MFQNFETSADPSAGPGRLSRLRDHLRGEGLAGFMVPRADVHQGEYVAARDERLQWLTGFTGSAGFAIVLPDVAGVFIDGRYRVQVKHQVDLTAFTPVPWPETKPGPWIADHLAEGVVGFDPWLHTGDEVTRLEEALKGTKVTLRAVENAVDAIWPDQPAAPVGAAFPHPVTLAGESSEAKRVRLAEGLRKAGQEAAVITLPDSLCWLLNLRGADVPRNPILHGFAILRADGSVDVFTAPAKLGPAARAALDAGVRLHPVEAFETTLQSLSGKVRVDRATAPLAVSRLIEGAGGTVVWGDDPCRLPKATKNAAEVAGMREAHLRDGAAMVEFLCWLDDAAPKGGLTEIDVVTALEAYRRATNVLHDISFDTICGTGPNGAIMHYRVTHETNRTVGRGELLLVDSGAQYADGTTDITRTIAVGDPGEEARACYTRVLQGLIAISRVRWPRGIAGRDLDALARFNLWVAGQDFDHGTGHGVGAFLSVHEGPQRLSRVSEVPLEPGMILSNEPGYYREGAFGIRLENLIVVQEAPPLGDKRDQLCFETLTFAPFDRRLILADRLSPDERDWLNAYHAEVQAKLSARLGDAAADWLKAVCAPL
ncbi:aminopeptidase P family protein [Fuscovulum ytuae]|uniref:Aminopeptidase P family protein n=1 Tax=Fuscovulum ytuae TaxID=3042299 RepID=A0ABY8Q8R3_9RHOB|nr:aminopeptidase P family protein [Fuscovulum sp. YMD61]WGV17270.1 aminopeptidase P family protein [Fuscovulum sp. YMD61]